MTSDLEQLPRAIETLSGMVERARATLANATTAAEYLDARDQAIFARTAAKLAERLAKQKNAHETVVQACRKAIGETLMIEVHSITHVGRQVRDAERQNPGVLQKTVDEILRTGNA